MKPDIIWPPAPLPHPHEATPADLPPPRLNAVAHLAILAAIAEEHLVPGETLLPDDAAWRSPLAFVAGVLAEFAVHHPAALPPLDLEAQRVCPAVPGVRAAGLHPLNGKLLVKWARAHETSPHLMLIDVPRTRGMTGLGPLRGDIAVFADGHCAIVTGTMCRGCQHFEAVEFTPQLEAATAPTIRQRDHWAATITHLIRVVIETPVVIDDAPSSRSEPALKDP